MCDFSRQKQISFKSFDTIFRCPAQPGASLVTSFVLQHVISKHLGFFWVSLSSLGFLMVYQDSLVFFTVPQSSFMFLRVPQGFKGFVVLFLFIRLPLGQGSLGFNRVKSRYSILWLCSLFSKFKSFGTKLGIYLTYEQKSECAASHPTHLILLHLKGHFSISEDI